MKKKALDFLNRSRVETPKVYQSARDAVDQNLKAIEEFEFHPVCSGPAGALTTASANCFNDVIAGVATKR